MGLTLIELIISIAILGIIIASFIPLFVMSANSNRKSENTLDSTHLGKDAMEVAYSLSKNTDYEELEIQLVDKGYEKLGDNKFGFEYVNNKYLNMKFSEDGNLVRVIVKIYKDKNMTELEVQYESLYTWIGRGILK